MIRRIHLLQLSVEFPSGIAPGEDTAFNHLKVARNGRGDTVLRGTSLAGAIRSAWRKHQLHAGTSPAEIDEEVRWFFGSASGDEDDFGIGEPSRLQVSDCVLNLAKVPTNIRTHHLHNRHSGTVVDGGLFSLETCPLGTRTNITLWLTDNSASPDESLNFLKAIAALFHAGMTLGGKSSRGVGSTKLVCPPLYRLYELTQVDGYARWLDDHEKWRQDPSVQLCEQPIESEYQTASHLLNIEFSLVIPRGQDVLIGDGKGLDHDIEPQRVTGVDGKTYWRLPGASLRGVFRSWMNHLATREGRSIADSVERQQQISRGELSKDQELDQRLTGDNLGWCFLPKEQRKQGIAKTDCPIASLFGSLFQASRIHIADAYSELKQTAQGLAKHEQVRMHVAVDRITGGAAEGMLFKNTVLVSEEVVSSPVFPVTIRIDEPTEDETRWLAATLRALDLGILRIGSSKSSGRLALQAAPVAHGPHADLLTAIQPSNI